MADHLSDEEQLEALKKWWQRNGTALLLVLLLTVGGWSGWHFWQNRQQQAAEQASYVYMAMLDALTLWEKEGSEAQATAVASQAETLKKISATSQYGRYGALTLARLAVADGDYENAAAELNWALASGGDDAFNALVRLRLASVEFARNNGDNALKLLSEPHPQAFNGLYSEMQGDILAAQGRTAEAGEAYQAAMGQLDESEARTKALLELKLNEVKPAEAAKPAGKEEA